MGVCWQTTGDSSSKPKNGINNRLTNNIIIASQPNNNIQSHQQVHTPPLNKPIHNIDENHSINLTLFDQSYEDCAVSLLLNNVTIFTSIVDENGQVIVPSSLTGVFELQITVDDVVYWAEVIL